MGNWGRCRFVEKEEKEKSDEIFKGGGGEFGRGIFPRGFCNFLPGGFEIEMDLHRWRQLQKHKISNIFSFTSSRTGCPSLVRVLAASYTNAD